MSSITTYVVIAIVAALELFGVVAITIVTIPLQQQAEAVIDENSPSITERAARAPVVVSGNNIYIAWWTNKTANNNEEVMFRASTDGGQTFGDKINLSNTSNADSTRAEIAAEGADVAVTWWETNQTSDTPVARLSSDGGQTFGPMLRLGTNGTISSTDDETTTTTTASAGEEG